MSIYDKVVLAEEERHRIYSHALESFPEECCGFIIDGKYVACKNIASEPQEHAKFSKQEFAKYFPQAQALVHSHTVKGYRGFFDPRTPSEEDFTSQKLTNIPWLIVATDGKHIMEEIQFPHAFDKNYLERPFIWYVNDCFTLIQDWFFYEKNITLPHAKYYADFNDMRNFDSLFTDHIEDYGFIKVIPDEIKAGDIILIAYKGLQDNHIGVFDGEYVLHQNVLSEKVAFESFATYDYKILRHKSLC